MSEDARALYQYLLTSPHNNALCCYVLRPLYAADDLQWSPERVQTAMGEVANTFRPDGTPMVIRDPETHLVAVYGQLEKEKIVNPNAMKSCITALNELPTQSNVFAEPLRACLAINPTLKDPFLEPLIELIGKRLPEPLREQQSQSQSQSQKEEEGGNGEIFISIPLKDGSEYQVTNAQVQEWAESYPALGIAGVEQGLRDARQWCLDKPENRKTRKGAKRFLGSWLQRDHKAVLEKQAEGNQQTKGKAGLWEQEL